MDIDGARSANVTRFRHRKQFDLHSKPISSIDIQQDGNLMITGGLDESISVYDAITGTYKNRISSKKYGAELVRFGGSSPHEAVVASLNGWNHAIRLLSLEKNSYIGQYTGHRGQVKSMQRRPQTPTIFASSAEDNSIRLWDFRSPNSQACVPHKCAQIAFDPLGIVLAAATPINSPPTTASSASAQGSYDTKIHRPKDHLAPTSSTQTDFAGIIDLFDSRMLDSGPFVSWLHTLSEHDGWTNSTSNSVPTTWSKAEIEWRNFNPWSSVQFSPSGESLLLSTCSSAVIVVDAFSGERTHCWSNRWNSTGKALEATFSPDGSSILTGSTNGDVHIYDFKSGEQESILGVGVGPDEVDFILSDYNNDRPDRHFIVKTRQPPNESSSHESSRRDTAREDLTVRFARFHPRATHPMIVACAGSKLHLFSEVDDKLIS